MLAQLGQQRHIGRLVQLLCHIYCSSPGTQFNFAHEPNCFHLLSATVLKYRTSQEGSSVPTKPTQAISSLEPELEASQPYSWTFWMVILALCLIAFASSLDGSIIAIALPHISQELSAGDRYVWIAGSFVLAQAVIQPPCAQLCNIFGRRYPAILAVAVFALGSSIAGGAQTTNMLIAGRTVQGLGSGGIMLMVELIICDLVPLRERSKFLGIVMSVSAIGAIGGPVVGGAIAQHNWRWVFYLNLPIASIVIAVMVLFLRLKHEQASSWSQALSQVDWIGNFVFVSSTTSLLFGLIFGGSVFPWSSWRTVLPIVLGAAGWALFHFYESTKLCKHPCIPPHLFGNQTSAAGLYIAFISSMLLQWVCFFWPVYFQAIKWRTTMGAGIDFLPFVCFLIPGASVAGVLLAKIGRYRRLHVIGFLLSTFGPGLNALLNQNSSKAIWIVFQMIDAIGRACLLPTVLPAILASLSEADVAAATGMYSFLRSLGYVWGITIPGIIFNNRFSQQSFEIADSTTRSSLSNGRAYEFASGAYVQSLPTVTKEQVIKVYLEALKVVWLAAVGFGVSGLAAVSVEKHITLRTEMNTAFGLDDSGERPQEAKEEKPRA